MIIPHIVWYQDGFQCSFQSGSVTTEAPEEIVQHRVAHQYHLLFVQLAGRNSESESWDAYWLLSKWESDFSSRISTENP